MFSRIALRQARVVSTATFAKSPLYIQRQCFAFIKKTDKPPKERVDKSVPVRSDAPPVPEPYFPPTGSQKVKSRVMGPWLSYLGWGIGITLVFVFIERFLMGPRKVVVYTSEPHPSRAAQAPTQTYSQPAFSQPQPAAPTQAPVSRFAPSSPPVYRTPPPAEEDDSESTFSTYQSK
jgi:hypothetical protein